MEQQRTEMRSITAEQQKRVEEVCFRSLALIGRNCEYLEQHFDRTGADESTRQAVADINTAAMQLDRTLCAEAGLSAELRGAVLRSPFGENEFTLPPLDTPQAHFCKL